jgi:hypothetical protein
MDVYELAASGLNHPQDASFDDERLFVSWAGTPVTTHRDADVLTRSNFRVISEELTTSYADEVYVLHAGHWAVGWVEFLVVKVFKDDVEIPWDRYDTVSADDVQAVAEGYCDVDPIEAFTPAFCELHDWVEKLDGYPVADEDDWSQLEYDELLETLTGSYDVPADHAGAVAEKVHDAGYSYADDISEELVEGILDELAPECPSCEERVWADPICCPECGEKLREGRCDGQLSLAGTEN